MSKKALFINLAWDAAGCSILQSKAINKHTDWKVRHYRGENTFNYPTDIIPENYNKDEFISIIEESDVIEWGMTDNTDDPIVKYNPKLDFGFDLREKTKGKVNIFHDYASYDGTWQQNVNDKLKNRCKIIGCDAIFTSVPQALQIYDNSIYIPDVVDELSDDYTPIPKDFSKIYLGHYPTGGGNRKNTNELRAALAKEPAEHVISNFDLTHDKLIESKKKINLGFDCIWRGYNGMTSIENFSLGIPTMCGIDDSFWKPFEECFDTTERPWEVIKNVDDTIKTIRFFKTDLQALKNRSDAVRNFMLTKWSFKNIANRIVKNYELLLSKK